MIKDENYFVVHGWMRTQLGLKGNELTTYAILYGFSQDGESEFRGKLEYISEFSGAHRDTVRATLKNLKEKGLVEKVERNSKTGETNGWICVPLDKLGGCGKFTPPLRDFRNGVAENSHPPYEISAPIKNNYKETYKEDYKKESKKENINNNLNLQEATDKELISFFENMSDEELITFGEKPLDLSSKRGFEILSAYGEEVKKRKNIKSEWKGKIVKGGGVFERLESHEEIMTDFGVKGALKEKLTEFLRHCALNKRYVLNDKLKGIIVELSRYGDESEQIEVIERAINGGYFDIKRLGVI